MLIFDQVITIKLLYLKVALGFCSCVCVGEICFMPLSDSLQNNKELYVRGSGYMRLLPHRQIQHAAVYADCLTSVNHRSMKTGKRGVSERQQKILKKQKFFNRLGLRTAAGRIIKFSLLKHATSPNTWAHKYILKLLNTCSQVTFLLLDPQLYTKKL